MTIRSLLPMAGLALALAVPTFAAETTGAADKTATPAVTETPAAAGSVPASPKKAAVRRSPLALALQATLDREAETMAALQVRLAATRDGETAFALQKQMEQLKFDTEIALLQVQADHHRIGGRVAAAEQLEAVIRDMKAPPRAFAPIQRPAPAGAGN